MTTTAYNHANPLRGMQEMAATENTSPKSPETGPIKELFDLASTYATVWGFVALCLWLERLALAQFGVPESPQIAILAVSTIAVFWLTMHRFEKDTRVRELVDQIRYIVILVAAGLVGAYLHANWQT